MNQQTRRAKGGNCSFIMNMTVVTFELVALCSLLLLAATAAAKEQLDMPDEVKSVGDERRPLDDQQLGEIVRDFGGHLQKKMEAEMERLLEEVQTKPSAADQGARKKHPNRKVSAEELKWLKKANRKASNDIKERVELAGDNGANMPQIGVGSMAASFAAAASNRLSTAGSYISNKMQEVGSRLKGNLPHKLRQLFNWPSFLRFKTSFKKKYRSVREELYRQMIFLHSHISVGMQHMRFLLGRDKHVNGQTQYSDMTEKEYIMQVGNQQGESGAQDLDPKTRQGLEPEQKAKLEELARSGKNIFGQPVGKVVVKSRTKRHAIEHDEDDAQRSKRQRRHKRWLDDDSDDEMYDSDEINQDEDDLDDMDLDNKLDSDADYKSEDAFRLVDAYAAGINVEDLDDIESNIDVALNVNNKFTAVDLRQTGCMMQSENQDNCGCCYSYAIHALAGYFNCIESGSGMPLRYHARFMSECGRYMDPPDVETPHINGCKGGRLSKGYLFTKTVGVLRFGQYQMAKVNAKPRPPPDTCVYPRPASGNLSQHGWEADIEPVPMFQRSDLITITKDEVDLHLRTVGPVAVNSNVWVSFKEYSAGIVDKPQTREQTGHHSMVIVGHDRDVNGRDYWIILNSHGIAWGEYGYLRVYTDLFDEYASIYFGLAPSLS